MKVRVSNLGRVTQLGILELGCSRSLALQRAVSCSPQAFKGPVPS